ncbi:hypothetical protein I862_07305 [endosymbiont of Acanthamoeba sp. UWC8]|uniref:hypothetical protein n=1 Tax=endosymbiont of Acanthamoeba sp. UWC8 TaxID=86106 RepID=UPI0004D14F10|nr:hypothetical protein [endosymbiont of Acanthamoeba sp. UWC8]AIF82015.1 hypothetical protein I862_07305 [endosymbiont of Acanthamoeba sp. UWC8]
MGYKEKNKKVVMVVANAVTHDIRVLKEAVALHKNGYEVTILGIDKKGKTLHYEGVNIILVELQSFSQVIIKPWLKNFYLIFH